MRFRVALLLLLCSTSAFAEVVASRQVLDRVYSFSPGAVLEMHFPDYNVTDPFENLGLVGPGANLNLQACKATAVGGVYCLDGQVVRQWKDPLEPATSIPVFNCATDFPGTLRLGKNDGCVAMTVDLKGQIWLAVKKGNSHNVRKVVRNGNNDVCSASPGCTISEPFTGRPPIVDLVAVDGDIAKTWQQSGAIGIEERKNAVLFPDAGGAPITVVSAASWNLKGKELLQDVSLLQLEGSTAAVPQISVLATTTQGRVLTRGVTESGTARALSITAPGLAACSRNAEAVYGIRTSSTTGVVYISDSKCQRVIATEANGTTVASFGELTYVNELSTTEGSASFDVIGLTIAPGATIDLTDCSSQQGCSLVSGLKGPNGADAASLLGVQLASSDSGATVFQIKGIPDCRMGTLLGTAEQTICAASGGVVIDNNGNAVAFASLGSDPKPAKYRLNVTPLLPDEVKLAFKASHKADLPDLLISRQYQASNRTGYIFEAFFVLPQPKVQFQNTFNTEYQVGILEGAATEHYNCSQPGTNLINWDVTTHVSELNRSVGGEFIDTLSNSGCGSIRGASATLSLLPYDLQISPDTWDPAANKYTAGNDAVFARLLQSLYADLYSVQINYACTNADALASVDNPNDGRPIDSALCASLTQRWNIGLPKLTDCINAAFQPKQSASNQLCQGFASQLGNYRDSLPTTTPVWDSANRVGELKARIETLFHLYNARFQPSIPSWGFCMESNSCTAEQRPPWAPLP